MISRHENEQAIGRDLALCDMVLAFGSASSKRKARAHRKACLDQIHQWNIEDGSSEMSDDELLAELTA